MLSRGLGVFIFQNVLLLALSRGPTRVARLGGTSLSLTHVLVCIAQRLELLMVLIQVVVLAYKGSEKGKKKMVHTVESVSMFLVMATILFTSVSSHAMRPSGLRR